MQAHYSTDNAEWLCSKELTTDAITDIQAEELTVKLDELPVEACFKIMHTCVETQQRRLEISPEEAAAGAKRLAEQSGIMKGQQSELGTHSIEAAVQSDEVAEQCIDDADGSEKKAHVPMLAPSVGLTSPPSATLYEGAVEESADRHMLTTIEEKNLILQKETHKLWTGGSVSVANCRDAMIFVTFAFLFIEVICGRSASDLAMDAACWASPVLSGALGDS
ncbi:hypothetical protein B0A48_15529 [Cryoendolithus antarcticus]|uniref:Uncharacterized protein n=1 Tax=Cryoendolithus antarcticus TaxID=1507870 RepID=A0A1V8SGP7_9PEZI|nr:hypothetical protein B0A48_15529 [Cryoendolithus antarcticus]